VVVSLLCRHAATPSGIRHHLVCNVEDSMDADLGPVFEEALPFIAAAKSRGERVRPFYG
jgi:hypothetical protein